MANNKTAHQKCSEITQSQSAKTVKGTSLLTRNYGNEFVKNLIKIKNGNETSIIEKIGIAKNFETNFEVLQPFKTFKHVLAIKIQH